MRKKEMIEMRSKGLSLQEIGDKYGITRERVRQIIGNTGRDFLKEHYTKSANSLVSEDSKYEDSKKIQNKRLASYFKKALPRIHHKISGKDNSAKFGEVCESEVSKILREHGVPNKLMPYGSSFDIETKNGYRIDVKATKKSRVFGNTTSTYYIFNVNKNIKKDFCDFFILYCYDTKYMYIVPYNKIPEVQSVYIRGFGHSHKWEKSNLIELEIYKNRFDLLK